MRTPARIDEVLAAIDRFARGYTAASRIEVEGIRGEIRDAIIHVAVTAAEDVAMAIQEKIPGSAPDVASAKVQNAWRGAALVALDQAVDLSNLTSSTKEGFCS